MDAKSVVDGLLHGGEPVKHLFAKARVDVVNDLAAELVKSRVAAALPEIVSRIGDCEGRLSAAIVEREKWAVECDDLRAKIAPVQDEFEHIEPRGPDGHQRAKELKQSLDDLRQQLRDAQLNHRLAENERSKAQDELTKLRVLRADLKAAGY